LPQDQRKKATTTRLWNCPGLTTLDFGTSPPLEDNNGWADFWRYQIGVNVIPADTKNKRTYEKWQEWQDKPIPEELHNQWKQENAYSKGLAALAGKCWFDNAKEDLFLNEIDVDNQLAVQELCAYKGKTISVEDLAKWTLVEQHADDRTRLHLYIFSTKPFPKKSSDIQKTGNIPAIEVKGLGQNGFLFCTPSFHKNGHRYEIIGTCKPVIADDFVNHIDNICKKYGLKYLDPIVNDSGNNSSTLIYDLFKEDTKVYEGHNRHEAVLRVIDSLLSRNTGILSSQQIKNLAEEWNMQHCVPPLVDKEFKKQWKCAMDFIEDSERRIDGDDKPDKTLTGQKQDQKKKSYVQKYSNEKLIAEAVLIGGLPKFLVLNEDDSSISIQDSIELEDKKILKPAEVDSYVNRPYSFSSLEQTKECIHKTKNETLDTLYRNTKSIWKKYIDADDFHISMCAADTISTYYQDRLGLTHYLFFVGNNNSGKSNNLHVFHWLGYRNMMSTDVTSANIYQFLGSDEEGVGTICEDEADNIDDDRDKMRIYKNGYTTGNPVLRTDTSYGRKQYRYNTFCFKAFAAERLPDSVKAKGFNQRIIELPCTYGFPQYDISEIINPAGEEEYEDLLRELNDIRNTLLIFRLLHYNEKLPDIKLNIHNREKQLFKPILRVFQKTETLKVLLPVISNYVSQKREYNANTLHAFLYRLIKELIKQEDTPEIASSLIWDTITKEKALEGDLIKPQTFQSVEFGQLSQKEITQILKDVFGATKSKRHGDTNKLVFDKGKLERLGKIYELSIEVKVTDKDNGNAVGGIHGIDGIHVGLDKHFTQSQNEDNIKSNDRICNNYNNNELNIEENTLDKIMNMPLDCCNGPQVSQVSQILADKISATEASDMPVIHHNADSTGVHESSQDSSCNDITSDSRPNNDRLEDIREVIFWQRFNELNQKSPDGTVKGEELRGSLVSSGQFYQSDAAMIIQHLVKTGKIEEVSFDTFKRAAG